MNRSLGLCGISVGHLESIVKGWWVLRREQNGGFYGDLYKGGERVEWVLMPRMLGGGFGCFDQPAHLH